MWKQYHVTSLDITWKQYQATYRTAQGLRQIDELSAGAFDQLDEHWLSSSRPIRREEKRRLCLSRQRAENTDRLHIRYQKLDTFGGERLALHLIRESRIATSINMITNTQEEHATLHRWSQSSQGVILIAGRSGSGKTTTAYCLLQEIAQAEDRVVFTLEDSVEFSLTHVNQVSVDLDDEIAYRRAFTDIIDSDLDVLFISSHFAQRHLHTLWGSALSAAESGHLVLVQIEADSVEDAHNQFTQATQRTLDEHLVGVVWQCLEKDVNSGQRSAHYDFLSGALDQSAQ